MITSHPTPQFARSEFRLLDGTWSFEREIRPDRHNCDLSERIVVPFCPESELSGIHASVGDGIMYSRTFSVSEKDLAGRLILHFGAVDFEATVLINGTAVVTHRGGYTPFSADIASFCHAGENRVTVLCRDDIHANVPSGKQTPRDSSFGCFYTRCTGIWQSVWLETTPKNEIRSVRFFPHLREQSVEVEVTVRGSGVVRAEAAFDGRPVGEVEGDITHKRRLTLPLSEAHLWSAGDGQLYEVTIRYGEDTVHSYFGLREVGYDGYRFLLNDESVFQRLVLDQGYYPEGIYTAKSDDDYIRDIRLAQEMGFNGARLHQKVFDPRFLYWCDKLGYLVWGEYASWGVRYSDLSALGQFVSEWTEAMERDFNHPSIVTWCPLNETWEDLDTPGQVRDVRFIDAVFGVTKALDDTRPCIDVSGGYHGHNTDIFDFHSYYSSGELKNFISTIAQGKLEVPALYAGEFAGESNLHYQAGKPVQASEFGGMAFSPAANNGWNGDGDEWGYTAFRTEESFVEEYCKMAGCLLACPEISGFCYTQLYDVEQECNGLFDYYRRPKFSEDAMRRIAQCNRTRAAVEK